MPLPAFADTASYHLPLPDLEPQNYNSPALTNQIVLATPGRLFGFTATSTDAAAQFILVFDEEGLPADGAVPLFALNASATSAAATYFGTAGRWFNRGVVICNSTTQGSKTIGAADTLFDVQFTPQVV